MLNKRYIKTAGNGVEAHGNCDVVIRNSQIIADKAAIRAYGNGDVVIHNSLIQGKRFAVRASGSSDVVCNHCTIKGAIRTSGNADFKRRTPPSSAASASWAPAALWTRAATPRSRLGVVPPGGARRRQRTTATETPPWGDNDPRPLR